MKRIILIIVIVIALVFMWIGYPYFRKIQNMESEYETVSAIEDLKEYLRSNGGKWPARPEDLGSRYTGPIQVHLDFKQTSEFLIEHPEELKQAVRPESGVFYTYPHYDAKIAELFDVLKESHLGKSH